MRKLIKNKKGFTLVEIVLVIAIIIILASALVINLSDIINNGKAAGSSIDEGVSQMRGNISASEDKLAGYGF